MARFPTQYDSYFEKSGNMAVKLRWFCSMCEKEINPDEAVFTNENDAQSILMICTQCNKSPIQLARDALEKRNETSV